MADPPRVFTIPAGIPFVDALASGLLERAGGHALALADFTVLLPNRRACRALGEAFLRQGAGRALLLPRLTPIGDVDEDELDAAEVGPGLDDPELPPAIGGLRRQFLLARLLVRAGPALGARNLDRAMRLAAELAALLDDAQTAGVELEHLAGLAPDAYAEHWRKSLRFLGILTRHWPRVLAAEGLLDPADRRNRLLARLAARWRAAPPATPVVAAGSTGSIPATADLLAVVAGLPNGAIVLPGLDTATDDATWDAIGDTHPQAGLKRLLAHLDVRRNQVAPWPGTAERPRFRLLADALRPAGTLGAWRALPRPGLAALGGLARVECPSQQVEAGVVALAMRATLESPGATAALVTRDRSLARRVAEELGRWDLAVDDSAGQPLATTPPGAFLRLAVGMAETDAAPVPLLALLKHPLAAAGRAPGAFRSEIRAVERAVLRGPRPAAGFKGLADALKEARAPRALRSAVGRLRRAAAPFMRLIGRRRVAFGQVLDAHVRFAEWLATTDELSGADRLWAREAGEALAAFVAEVAEASTALGPIRGADYGSILDALMAGRVVRPRWGRHPRLFIWGPLEARLQGADLMILGGLDEGSWPPLPEPDPWLSRPMRAALGLPARERRVGQAAHDFMQGAAGPRVLLTRSAKVDGAPTVPSRWLVRLETFLAAHGIDAALDAEAEQWLAWQANLDRPARVSPMPAPVPAPPVDKRPRSLSVTGIETWLRDPYAIHAKYVLGLARLDPIDADPGAAERGQYIHDALDRFVRAYPAALPDDAYDRLLAHGRQAFGPALGRPSVHAFWWPRFERIARWFVEEERERRARAARVLSEVGGTLALAAPAGPFVLRAKADRIDVRADGSLAVIDYKTGALPRKADATSGLAPQLPLEAAIAGGGGFTGAPAGPVGELAFWHLSGDDPPGRVIDAGDAPDALAREAAAGLRTLVARFDDVATPYLACPRPALAPRYNDYDHLERREEWEAGAAEVPPFRPVRPSRPGGAPSPPLPDQRRMSDPAASAWVTASAGAGKTKVLTDRVLRLLLAGAPPGRLLCLTFTKAAAAEMATRIERRLGAWATATDADLADDLAALTGTPLADDDLARARRLFADVLEAPGGLPIMTIHAFCQALLARFPVEAEIMPGFEVADPRTARELQAEALDSVIHRSRVDPILGRHLGVIAGLARDVTARAVVEQIVDARGRFSAALRRHGTVDGAVRALGRMLDVSVDETVAGLVGATVDPASFDEAGLRAAAGLLGGGSPGDARLGDAILDFLSHRPVARAERLDAYRRLFLTEKEQPRRRLVSADLARAYPRVVDPLSAEAERLARFVERRNRIVTAEASMALWHVGDAVLEAYARRKESQGVLDYEDLVLTAADLVTRPGIAPWVLYKLDGGIDHVLVDEAQDTNPDQWRIIAALADEFFAGAGARELDRTLFVVGDEKQSIFSFQGADLEGLARVHEAMRARARGAGAGWLDLDMTLSFRSTEAVLEAVDRVFAGPARDGVSDRPIAHRASRAGQPGLVELWPLVRGGGDEPAKPWDVPTSYVETDDPATRLARHIAATIEGWCGVEPLGSQGRAIRPGDVMVLVRRRDRLLHAIVRELRRRNVAVAGVDRMVLTDPLAVRDLTALIEAALLPEDDLTLACVLKGPFVGLDEDALLDLAAGRRPNERLWSTLARAARRDDRLARAHDWLTAVFARADFATPHGFLSAALNGPVGAASGRGALLGRLGLEAEDPVDELLAQALAYESRHAPTLQGFVRWLGHGDIEITRDLDHGRDEVRVITVHGAKGLEAPIVILPDTVQPPRDQGPRLLWYEDHGGGLLWSGRAVYAGSHAAKAQAARQARMEAEYRRLLYVALTRAADRLYIGGWSNKGEAGPSSWYRLAHDALAPVAEPFPFEAWPGQGLRLVSAPGAPPERVPAPPVAAADAPASPAWARLPAPIEAATPPPLAPSRVTDEPAPGAPIGAERMRRLRGRAIHRLLELLPGVPRAARRVVADRILGRLRADWAPAIRDEMVASVIALLEAPDMARLFGPGSRAEVSVVGVVGDRVVAGQVDRLVVADDVVIVADFKSDRAPVGDAARVPAAYRRQMTLYAALLRRVFPGRAVRTLLVWTEGPTVTALDGLELP